jgi:hypothetical protein
MLTISMASDVLSVLVYHHKQVSSRPWKAREEHEF